MRALGLDPGLAHLGWSIVDLSGPPRVLALGCLRTKKDPRKVLLSVDLHRRGQLLARELAEVLDLYPDLTVCCAESLSWVRSAATMAAVGRAWGVVDALLERRKLALLQVSPQEIKKAATGKISASKSDVLLALDRVCGGSLSHHLCALRPKALHEHPADATGAVIACLERDELRLARAARQRTLEEIAP